ncbi:hypothetical protein JL108_04345 [Aeromicrobium sp. YIM 150415]|uniref:hypothetical protein n=1 Tax=Aeromicrobium sp. YIM 150415 TaxID=2803912 RepID=UPI0019652F5F|nr:hypothetical protein [Aeromicrobium sp. YIM 150415]MBM9462669.1 hypothetical protein [Aeromicrobium sp. YIM 150415]
MSDLPKGWARTDDYAFESKRPMTFTDLDAFNRIHKMLVAGEDANWPTGIPRDADPADHVRAMMNSTTAADFALNYEGMGSNSGRIIAEFTKKGVTCRIHPDADSEPRVSHVATEFASAMRRPAFWRFTGIARPVTAAESGSRKFTISVSVATVVLSGVLGTVGGILGGRGF